MANTVRSGHRHPTSGWFGFAGLVLIPVIPAACPVRSVLVIDALVVPPSNANA
jgi:hypothetical protein